VASLQHQAPKLLDARRMLMLNTVELVAAVAGSLAVEVAADRG
jgi:hypothetical protein